MQTSRYTMIFEAIRELLEERDVDTLTVNSIAERCHLHANTVNYYFNGKADMMMRFHTYVTNVRTSGLPDSYYRVPQEPWDAVKAFAEVVDLELFRVDYSSQAQRRLYLYLFSNIYAVPQIRHYLVEKEDAYNIFLRGVFEMYADAGIIDPRRLDEGLTSMTLITLGYTFIHYYYRDGMLPELLSLRGDRRRLLFTFIEDRHHPLVVRLLGESQG